MTDAQLAQVVVWLRDHMAEIHSAAQGGDRRKLVEGPDQAPAQDTLSRAAIAAVLDDLAVLRPWTMEVALTYWPDPSMGVEGDISKFWKVILTEQMRELGLASPTEPGDAPNDDPGQYAPTEG